MQLTHWQLEILDMLDIFRLGISLISSNPLKKAFETDVVSTDAKSTKPSLSDTYIDQPSIRLTLYIQLTSSIPFWLTAA